MNEQEDLKNVMDNVNERIQQAFNPCKGFLELVAFVAVMEMTVTKIKDNVPEVAITSDAPKRMFDMGESLRVEREPLFEGGLENG